MRGLLAARRIGRPAYLLVGALLWFYLYVVIAPAFGTFGADAFAYWHASPPLYATPHGEFGAYVYSPAFYQLTAPLRLLDWVGFAWVWGAINLATAVWLGPLAMAFPATPLEIYFGNIHLLIAAAVVLGFRHPWAWAFVLHTKVTPGVGLLWFVVRGEWRNVAVALGASVLVGSISYLLAPDLWVEYVKMLLSVQSPGEGSVLVVGIPFLVRLPLAAVLVAWGGRTDHRWTVPVAAMLALPELWWHGLAVGTGALALARPTRLTLPSWTTRRRPNG